jgi:hypothetical protein
MLRTSSSAISRLASTWTNRDTIEIAASARLLRRRRRSLTDRRYRAQLIINIHVEQPLVTEGEGLIVLTQAETQTSTFI